MGVGFVSELVVEGAFGFSFRGDVGAVFAVPAPFACGVSAVFELLDCLPKGLVGSFGSVEFDDGSTIVFYCPFTYSRGITYIFESRLTAYAPLFTRKGLLSD